MKTVMIFGTFDIVHAGHINLFKQAKQLGDHVIAVIARDKRVADLKGRKPIHSESERRDFLKHIDLLDRVILGSRKDVYMVIKKYKPDYILLGYDQKHFVDSLTEYIAKYHMPTLVKRARTFKAHTLKSGKIKHYIETVV